MEDPTLTFGPDGRDEFDITTDMSKSRITITRTYRDPNKRFDRDGSFLLSRDKALEMANKIRDVVPVVSDMLEKGWPVMEVIKGSSMKLIMGDVSLYIQDKIKSFNDNLVCTKNLAGNNFIKQDGYQCLDCFPGDETMVICKSCALLCHSNHNVVKIDESKYMFCDCSDSSITCEAQ